MTGTMRKAAGFAALLCAAMLVFAGAASSSSTSPKLLVTVAVGGKGMLTTVVGGIHCPRHCRTFVAKGRTIRFVAKPAKKWKLDRWVGACEKSKLLTCSVKVDNPVGVRVTFSVIRPKPPTHPAHPPRPAAPTPPTTTTSK
jgi:hypothetical protein